MHDDTACIGVPLADRHAARSGVAPDRRCRRRGTPTPQKQLVAHRGASAYAPEHTLEAYRLAIEQGADFVEQDLAVTKDGVLVCIHDLTLERTTNVEEVFPDRFVRGHERRRPGDSRWLVADFTLAEIKQLDAGSWFNAKFAGARIPTFQEAIDAVRGKARALSRAEGSGVLPRPRREPGEAARRRADEERPAADADARRSSSSRSTR